MFCSNCGTQLNNSVAFCPNCGNKLDTLTEKSENKPNIINKKLLKTIISLVLVVCILVSGIQAISYINSIPSDKEIKLVANNLMNGGFVASDGKWLFYYEYENQGLYRERLSDGEKKELVLPEMFEGELFFLGDKLYIESISAYSTMKVNDKKCVEIPNTTFTAEKFQTDGRKCYFDCFHTEVDEGNLVSQKLDGSKGKTIAPITSSRIMFDGDSLYVFSSFGLVNNEENTYMGVTKMETDGTNQSLIMNYCPSSFVFGENKIFYIKDNYLYSMNFDGTSQEQIGDIKVGKGLNAYDGYVYFIDYDSGNICRFSEDGNYNSTILNDCRCEKINIVEDWIFYKNSDESLALYKMKLDGTENQVVYK